MRKTNLLEANKGKFDPINSTYRHEIYLRNGKVLTGYSKGLNVNEMPDKDRLIQVVIGRLYRNGYLHPKSVGYAQETNEIIFYFNDPVEPDWICSLYPRSYRLAPGQADNKLLINFLNRFYEQIKTGKERKNLVKEPRHQKLLDKSRRFKSEQELLSFVNEAIDKYGIPNEIAKRYYEIMIQKFNQ